MVKHKKALFAAIQDTNNKTSLLPPDMILAISSNDEDAYLQVGSRSNFPLLDLFVFLRLLETVERLWPIVLKVRVG